MEAAIQSLMRQVARLQEQVHRLATQGTTAGTGGAVSAHGNESHTTPFATQAALDAHTGATSTSHTLRGLADYNNTTPPTDGQVPAWDETTSKWLPTTPAAGGGADTFLELSDTPADYTGQGTKIVAVNTAATALEFITKWATTFLGLTDTPSDYTGQGGKYLAVNSGATAIEFVAAPSGGTTTATESDSSPSIAATTMQFPKGTLDEPTGGTARYRPQVSVSWPVGGDLALGDEYGFLWEVDRDVALIGVSITAKSAPVGSAAIFDIDWASALPGTWASIFSVKPQVADGSQTGGSGATFSVTTLSAGSYVRFNIDQIGSSNAGSGVLVTLKMREI